MTAPVNIICMRWGKRYPVHYVNRLFQSVARQMDRPFRFVCFTDDETGLAEGIEAHPLPPITLPEAAQWSPWRKMSIWQHPLAGLEGDVLFLDLDLLVVGPLGDLFDHQPGTFCVIENWTQAGEGIGNTSVFRFPAGKYTDIFTDFTNRTDEILRTHRIEQHYISAQLPDATFWPVDWCISFKHSVVPRFPLNWVRSPEPPPNARVIVFTGRPDIDEAAKGYWPAPWFKRFYKHARPAPWINAHWRDE